MAVNNRIRLNSEAEPEFTKPGALEAVIGAQAREYRHASGRSMAQVASEMGVSKAMLSNIENAQT